ncbi:MAG: hypothetical protein ACLQMF_08620 [Rectinemataceae bacterium]
MSRPNQYSSEKRRKELEKKRKKEEKILRKAEAKRIGENPESQLDGDQTDDSSPADDTKDEDSSQT